MASFNELYDEVTLVNSLSMFESTDDMDDEDIEFMESLKHKRGKMTTGKARDQKKPDKYELALRSRGDIVKYGDDGSYDSTDDKYELTKYRDGTLASYGNGNTSLINVDDSIDFIEIEEKIDSGKVAAAVALFAAAALVIITKIKKKAATRSAKNRISNLEKAINKVKSLQNSGNLSPREAKKEIRRITKELNALVKDIEKGRFIKESATEDDLRLEIYESCYYGDITEEERDILLDLL